MNKNPKVSKNSRRQPITIRNVIHLKAKHISARYIHIIQINDIHMVKARLHKCRARSPCNTPTPNKKGEIPPMKLYIGPIANNSITFWDNTADSSFISSFLKVFRPSGPNET